LAEQGAVISTTVDAIVFGSFAVNLALSTSLNFLWSMINCQQVLMTFPLFWINFPANALTFYSFLITISTFNVIPIEEQSISILDLEEELPFNT